MENPQRDTELENIVGNLLVTEYQVEKLKGRLLSKIDAAYLSSSTDKNASTFLKAVVGGLKFRLM